MITEDRLEQSLKFIAETDDNVYYNGHQVWAYYCQGGDGKLLP